MCIGKLLAVLCLLLPAAGGCVGTGGEAGVADGCQDSFGTRTFTRCRAFRGRLQLPHQSRLRLDGKSFQIAALGFGRGNTASDGGGTADAGSGKLPWLLFSGAPFAADSGSGMRASIPFSIVVPCELSVNLLLQVTRGGGAPGIQVAQMKFASSDSSSSTLVPGQAAEACGGSRAALDLGQVSLLLPKNQLLTGSSITLGQGKSKNPLSLLDTDSDQLTDLADSDDDGDGIADLTDTDADGDGIIDALQLPSALPDRSGGHDKDGKPTGDGIPDLFQ